MILGETINFIGSSKNASWIAYSSASKPSGILTISKYFAIYFVGSSSMTKPEKQSRSFWLTKTCLPSLPRPASSQKLQDSSNKDLKILFLMTLSKLSMPPLSTLDTSKKKQKYSDFKKKGSPRNCTNRKPWIRKKKEKREN